VDEKLKPGQQDSRSEALRASQLESEEGVSQLIEDSRPNTSDRTNNVHKTTTISNDGNVDMEGGPKPKRRTSGGLSIHRFAEFNEEDSMTDDESRNEESAIDIQQALSRKPDRLNVNAPAARPVQNESISNSVQPKAAQASLAAQKAKEAKAKAIAAAYANRKAKLAAVEWMDRDSRGMAGETWSGSEDESPAPTPPKNGSSRSKPSQQKPPATAHRSHSMSKGPAKAVPVQTASAADWSESSSEDEPPPKATSRTTLSGGRPFVSINKSSAMSGRKHR